MNFQNITQSMASLSDLTFDNNDAFARKEFADRLTKTITTFHALEDEAFVLSLNATFGSGKTTFLHMWKNQLHTEDHTVLYLNAWESDFDEDPILPIVATILDGIESKVVKTTQRGLQAVLGTLALIGNKYLETKIGLDTHAIGREVSSDLKSTDVRKIGETVYKSFRFKKDAYNELKSSLTNYAKNELENAPLIILVDELDRVRPDYAVKFLEAIKHLFAVKGICFVLAVDREQLEKSVKQLYGEVDFGNYYLRFVTREVNLPKPALREADFYSFIEKIVHHYLTAIDRFNTSYSYVLNSELILTAPLNEQLISMLEQIRQVPKFSSSQFNNPDSTIQKLSKEILSLLDLLAEDEIENNNYYSYLTHYTKTNPEEICQRISERYSVTNKIRALLDDVKITLKRAKLPVYEESFHISHIALISSNIAHGLNLVPRQIESLLKNLFHFLATASEHNENHTYADEQPVKLFATCLLIALRLLGSREHNDSPFYKRMGTSSTPADYLHSYFTRSNNTWYTTASIPSENPDLSRKRHLKKSYCLD